MIDSILVNKDALMAIQIEREDIVEDLSFLEHKDFAVLEDLSCLLSPLYELTNAFNGTSYSTISILYQAIFSLVNNELIQMRFSNEHISRIKNELIYLLNMRFRYVFTKPIFLAAAYLNNNFKKFEFILDEALRKDKFSQAKRFLIEFWKTHEQQESANQLLQDQANASQALLCNATSPSSQIETEPSSSSQSVHNGRISKRHKQSFFIKIVDKSIFSSSKPSKLECEFKQYESLMSIDDSSDYSRDKFFIFHKKHASGFPILSHIARILLAVPATSVPCECLFSIAGIVQTELRNRINPLSLESYCMLKHNSKYFP